MVHQLMFPLKTQTGECRGSDRLGLAAKQRDVKCEFLSSRFSVGLSDRDKGPPIIVLFLPQNETEHVCFFLQLCPVGSAVVNFRH